MCSGRRGWTSWPDEATAELRRSWTLGHSGGQIAHAMGMTRSQVMGKLKRLGLLGTGTPRPKRLDLPCVHIPKPVPKPKREPIDTSPCKPVKLARIGAHQCRWPLWSETDSAAKGFPSCGRKTDGTGPYCGEHKSRAYQNHNKREAA